mgnify:CR=1 FL=1
MLPRITKHIDPVAMAKADYRDDVPLVDPTGERPANVVTSLLPNGMHAPVIDLDFPAMLVPSSTPGHSHLYLDVQLGWTEYFDLLQDLREHRIVQAGFVDHAHQRGLTVVRMPWFTKEPAVLLPAVGGVREPEPF